VEAHRIQCVYKQKDKCLFAKEITYCDDDCDHMNKFINQLNNK